MAGLPAAFLSTGDWPADDWLVDDRLMDDRSVDGSWEVARTAVPPMEALTAWTLVGSWKVSDPSTADSFERTRRGYLHRG